MDIFVNESEIKRMTGETSKAGQINSLKKYWKIPFRENPKGWPLILKSDVEKTLGLNRVLGTVSAANDGSKINEPDFSSMSK